MGYKQNQTINNVSNIYPNEPSKNHTYNTNEFSYISNHNQNIFGFRVLGLCMGKSKYFLPLKYSCILNSIVLHVVSCRIYPYISGRQLKEQLNFNMIIRTNPTIYKLN